MAVVEKEKQPRVVLVHVWEVWGYHCRSIVEGIGKLQRSVREGLMPHKHMAVGPALFAPALDRLTG